VTCRRCTPAQLCPACAALLARAGGTPAAQVTEAQLLARVREVAKRLGYMTYHVFNARKSEPGFCDLVLAQAHHPVIFTELKTTEGHLAPAQRLWRDALQASTGVEYYLWRPSDLEAIVEILRRPQQEAGRA